MYWRPRTLEDVLARITRGDGQGEGPGFVPWLDMNFSSKGRTRAFTGPIREGIGITVADLEHMATVLVEYARGTVDVRHQVALLPLEEPQDIAREMGVVLTKTWSDSGHGYAAVRRAAPALRC